MAIMMINIAIWSLSLLMIVCAFRMYAVHKAINRRGKAAKLARGSQINLMINLPCLIAAMGIMVFILCSIKNDLKRGFLPEETVDPVTHQTLRTGSFTDEGN